MAPIARIFGSSLLTSGLGAGLGLVLFGQYPYSDSIIPTLHGEVWGQRGGRPTILVGKPLELDHDGYTMIRTIEAFGLDVQIDCKSHHGHGFHRVLVFSWAAAQVRRPHLYVPEPACEPHRPRASARLA